MSVFEPNAMYAGSLREKLKYLPEDKTDLITHALEFAESAHEGQYRRSGDPYITHPLAVANILADMHMDAESIMAALLHDVIEDTSISKEDIAKGYGETVAELVDGVSKISAIGFEDKATAQAENFQKMMMAMTQDIRVILVKLADRLHNMRTLQVLNTKKKRRIATETLEIYAPIANRLGMNNIRVEFEDLGFKSLYPMRSHCIQKAVKKARGNRKELLKKLEEDFELRLKEAKLDARLVGREKHLYSIYRKMSEKRKSFDQIMDVYGFRIITNSVDDCYRALGVVHNLYTPIPGRFKDYIAIPKANGYQSIHTTLKGATGVPVEIQIRTEDMEAMANNGIAAHWLYKSNGQITNGAQTRARAWMQGLLEMQQTTGNSLEFIENVKIDLFPEEVYVFSPKGTIYEMVAGSTPVDFAYAVHTDVGNQCVAARVDDRLAPLSEPLQSGQTVEIITAPGTCPNPAWLSFAITGKARTNIRHFLKNQQRGQSVQLGQRLLEKALLAMNQVLEDIPEADINRVLSHTELDSLEDLLEQIGLGNRMAPLIAQHLAPDAEEKLNESRKVWQNQKSLTLQGTEGVVISYAKCCHPIPGDEVVGHLSSGRGMVVHFHTCRNISAELRDNPEKCLAVTWADNVKGSFTPKLQVVIENKRGVLASLATIIAQCDSDIESIDMGEQDAKVCILIMTLSVTNRVHLARVLRKLRAYKSVLKIVRLKG